MQNTCQQQPLPLSDDNNSNQKGIAQAIKAQTMRRFSSQFKAKFKREYSTSNVYTVICSMGFINTVNNQFEVVAVANGTKSLPYMLYQQHSKAIIKDMHAEILAIKAFRKFVVHEIVNTMQSKPSKYLIKNEKKNKLAFNSQNYKIFMYSSQPFCGDCSIQEGSGLFSGAKPLIHFQSNLIPNEKFQKHVLRTKPGRVDLPQHKKSLSLSCSDKLALYNILGIQGKQLFHKLQPLYIDIFIVQSSSQLKNPTTIRQGLDFIHRLSKLKYHSSQLIKRKIFNIIIDSKERRISNQFKTQHQPKIICLTKMLLEQNLNNNITTLTENNNDYEQLIKKKQKQGFQLSLIDCNGNVQWINSKTGLPEGSSLHNYTKKGKISQFSKQRFLEYILKENIYSTQVKDETFKYSAIKQRIKLLFGMWTDSFKGSYPNPIKDNKNQQSVN